MKPRNLVTPAGPNLTRGDDSELTPCAEDVARRLGVKATTGAYPRSPYDLIIDNNRGADIYADALLRARRMCGKCPIQTACLVANRDEAWVKAMVTGRQRPGNSEPGRVTAAACGTDSGYYRHVRGTKTEPKSAPCEPCRVAHAESVKRYKAEKRAVA